MEVVTDSVEKTHEQAKKLLDSLSKDKSNAVVIGLTGELAVGKTEFIRGLLRSAGVTDSVTSPTYTIETVYQLPDTQFQRAYHIDAYRLDSSEDLQNIGFENRLDDESSIILVEWANRVKTALPEDSIHIHIERENDKRVITIKDEQRK